MLFDVAHAGIALFKAMTPFAQFAQPEGLMGRIFATYSTLYRQHAFVRLGGGGTYQDLHARVAGAHLVHQLGVSGEDGVCRDVIPHVVGAEVHQHDGRLGGG